jgi:phosphatidylinositol-3-phosphatase
MKSWIGVLVGVLSVAAVIAVIAISSGSGQSSSNSRQSGTPRSSATEPAASKAPGSHVFVILLENHGFNQVIGNPNAPYINRLADEGVVATRYYAITHPSLPNYLAIIGGSTFGIQSDCTQCSARGSNLALQLARAGISWRAYMNGLESSCWLGGYRGLYAKKHNPFFYFPTITRDPSRCAQVVPGGRLNADLADGDVARFVWITPNTCQDAHDCAIAHSDRYLIGLVPVLLRELGPHGFLVITFDEGPTDLGCCGGDHGGRVATILVGPDLRHGARVKTVYDHYSLLRTLEDAFSLPHLRKANAARSMRDAFSRFPSLG